MAQEIVRTRVLHSLAQIGYLTKLPEYEASADSILSLVALHLKHEKILVPDEMYHHYIRLRQLAEAKEK